MTTNSPLVTGRHRRAVHAADGIAGASLPATSGCSRTSARYLTGKLFTMVIWHRIVAVLGAVLLVLGLVLATARHAEAATGCPVTGSSGQEQDLIASICNVPPNAQYGLRDSAGNSMDTMKVIATTSAPAYIAVYHNCTTNPCHMLVASSGDLRTWTYRATLQTDGAQPTVKRLSDGSYLVPYEAQVPADHLVVVWYSSLSHLLAGVTGSRFDVPDNLGACQGTPNIYSPVSYTSLSHSKFHIGFHWSNCANDREGTGTLTNFTTWSASGSTWLDTALDNAGAAGKHGDRDAIWHGGHLYDVAEGTTNPVYSPADWRLYSYGFTENAAVQIPVRTAGGSTAFANPTVTSLTGPGGIRDLVISIFIPSEGAAPGEGGELLYTVPDNLGTSQGALPAVIRRS